MTSNNTSSNDFGIDITVLITCYNEEDYVVKTIETVISALEEAKHTFEIVIIDDTSKDDSVKLINQYLKNNPNYPIKFIINKDNRGIGNNFVEGSFLGKGKYYRFVCGDNSETKEGLVNIFKYIGNADIIIPYHAKVYNRNFVRKTISKLYTHAVNIISGYRIRYYNGSAIHIRYNVMRWHPHSYGFGFQSDIITRLLDEGYSYMQVPSWAIERRGNITSALTIRNILSVLHTLVEITIRRLIKILYGKNKPKAIEISPGTTTTKTYLT